MMKPFVGKNYVPGGPKSLLLIGESHYLPPDSRQHLSPDAWYAGNASALTTKEQGWINISDIIRDGKTSKFAHKPYAIFRNAFREINDNGPNYPNYADVAEDIVFYNYFQRPAITKISLIVSKRDIEVAEQRFRAVAAEYKPAAIAFLSTLAFNHCAACRELTIPIAVTPHPGCSHWNRTCKKYGGKRGRDQLGALVRRLWQNERTTA